MIVTGVFERWQAVARTTRRRLGETPFALAFADFWRGYLASPPGC
jgi:hypothetical protein